MYESPNELFETARGFCLSHPQTFEKLSHGSPAFFIEKGGCFATLWDNHHNDGNVALLVAAPPGMQEAMIETDSAVFYRPPYVGPSDWIGVRLDKGLPWVEVEDVIATAYEFIAAKRKRPTKGRAS
jgi:phosphoribosylglycinamide formyltransferase-1/phosphoribosylamine--glycine ligase/phosphoribosylglycinamide formyltransferase/phosphoribosylformylglycinamidine cyclo-ligase